MKLIINTLCFLSILICGLSKPVTAQKPGAKKPVSTSASLVKNEKEEFDAAIALPPAQRIEKLKAFVEARPRSSYKARALELIVSAHATIGDEKLQAGDATGGNEQFRLAVVAIPTGMSDKLFTGVVSQIPSNLFLRGQQAAALEIARLIEARVKDNPKRLLTIAAFYLGVEAADDAFRAAELATTQAPELSTAFQARAAAHRIALRLEKAAADYARALELDPTSNGARRSLAELLRATGKTQEALALYKELLQADAKDEFARTGLVVSLFELGKKEEAELEFKAAITDTPGNLALLTGVAYWMAAHNENARAVELAHQAGQVEPRFTWAHIALARGLLAQKRPMEAERALITARRYGRFPTLDYELASVLASAGFYGEAASALLTSFTLKDDQIAAYLGGRTLAYGKSFTELLAPERRASIFQFTAADDEASASKLKSLLAFSLALNPPGGRGTIKESDVLATAREFVSGEDEMRAFRRFYVASRMLEYNVALPGTLEMMEAVTSEIEPALDAKSASAATMADELRDKRAQANAYDSTLNVPEIPRSTLANILRGQIEDMAGWALFHQGKFQESVVRLRRAASVLPENSVWWRRSLWHLGASLDATDKGAEALEAYYKSYRSGGPDPTRRAVIEGLYRKVNGSLSGLDQKIGPAPVIASRTKPTAGVSPVAQDKSAENVGVTKTADPTTTATQPTSETTADTKTVSIDIKPAEALPKSETSSGVTTGETETAPTATESKIETSSEPKVDAATTKAEEVKSETNPASDSKTETSNDKPAETQSKPEANSEGAKTDSEKTDETITKPVEVTPTAEPSPTPAVVEVPPGPPQRAVNDEPPATSTAEPEATKPAPKPASNTEQRERRVAETSCSISVSESALTIQNNGGRALINITLEGQPSAEGVSATTSDWASLAVFPEPRSGTDKNVATFSLSSISKKTGMFTVTFKTPCGTKNVTVTVR